MPLLEVPTPCCASRPATRQPQPSSSRSEGLYGRSPNSCNRHLRRSCRDREIEQNAPPKVSGDRERGRDTYRTRTYRRESHSHTHRAVYTRTYSYEQEAKLHVFRLLRSGFYELEHETWQECSSRPHDQTSQRPLLKKNVFFASGGVFNDFNRFFGNFDPKLWTRKSG